MSYSYIPLRFVEIERIGLEKVIKMCRDEKLIYTYKRSRHFPVTRQRIHLLEIFLRVRIIQRITAFCTVLKKKELLMMMRVGDLKERMNFVQQIFRLIMVPNAYKINCLLLL